MNVLFVYRGSTLNGQNPIVENQIESVRNEGVTVSRFVLSNGGPSYFKSYFQLRRYLKHDRFDIVHAHYGYTAIITGLANPGKTVASLMGSDIYNQNIFIRFIIKLFSKYIWSGTIVKSSGMKDVIPDSVIVPNGVNLNTFNPKDRDESISRTGLSGGSNVIFVAVKPEEKVKNLHLARKAIMLLGNEKIKLHIISNLNNFILPYYYSAADLLLLTSTSEGSPNVIKEAMACNCPIVSTDVGDVKAITGDTEGCFVTGFSPKEIASAIEKALEFSKSMGRTSGKTRITSLGLDSISVAKGIVSIYEEILKK